MYRVTPLAFAALGLGCSSVPPSELAALVNNQPIVWNEVDDALQAKGLAVTRESRDEMLRQVVQERLFAQAASECGLSVREEEVERELLQRLRESASIPVPGEAICIRTRTYKKAAYKHLLAQELLVHKLRSYYIQQEWLKSEPVSDQEVRAYFEEHRTQLEGDEEAQLRIRRFLESQRRRSEVEILRNVLVEKASIWPSDTKPHQ